MDVIKLRKLTRKSKLGYGLYAEKTVGELIEKRFFTALRWAYYNVQNITYMPDIMEELHIVGKWVIDKPGVDHDKYEAYVRIAQERAMGADKARLFRYWKSKKKAKDEEYRANREISASRLQRYNHGHNVKM